MTFSVGLWDTIFGKRITLEIPTCCGEVVRRSVTERWYELMRNRGTVMVTEERVVKVHMLDAAKGYTVLCWMVDEDIEKNLVKRYKDRDTGDLYAIHYFEEGEPKTEVLQKERWDIAYKKFQSL